MDNLTDCWHHFYRSVLGSGKVESPDYYLMQGAFMAGAASMLEILDEEKALRVQSLPFVKDLITEIESFEPKDMN